MRKFFFLLFFAVPFTAFPQAQPATYQRARTILDYLVKKEFGKITPWFDDKIAAKLDSAKLALVWNGLLQQAGAFKQAAAPTSEKKGDVETVDQLCQFEKMELMFRIGFNKDKKISSFLFLPSPQKENYKVPAYVSKDKFEEKDIVVKTGAYELPGTLSLPLNSKKFPLVIFVHGSGPNDRDESIGAVKLFKDLAGGLASSGIAVLRYDKRTYVYGSKSCDNVDSMTVKEEVMDDVASAIRLAKTIPGVDTAKIFVLGHSLGAMLLPRIATDNTGLAGIIMMAGNARPLEDLVLEQTNYLLSADGDFSKEDREKLGEVKLQCLRVKKLGTGPFPPASQLPLNCNAKYWYDLENYHQARVARDLSLPMLILQGERDYQVTMTDYNLWQMELGGKKNVKFLSFPKLNHAFTEGEGPKSKPEEYMVQANVPDYVVKEIVNFIKK